MCGKPAICYFCGVGLIEVEEIKSDRFPNEKTKDHLIPVSAINKHRDFSKYIVLVNCCLKCNNYKSNLSLFELLLSNFLSVEKFARCLTKCYKSLKTDEDMLFNAFDMIFSLDNHNQCQNRNLEIFSPAEFPLEKIRKTIISILEECSVNLRKNIISWIVNIERVFQKSLDEYLVSKCLTVKSL